MDNSQINEFFDLAALNEQAKKVLEVTGSLAEQMKKVFASGAPQMMTKDIEQVNVAIKKVADTTEKARKITSDYEKAEMAMAKAMANNNNAVENLTALLDRESNSIAEMTAQSKMLEAIRKNLNINDLKYAENQQKIIDKQNELTKKIKEYQTEEAKRTSGIGKYEEAIRKAMSGDGNYRQQLLQLRNTMADLEQEMQKVAAAGGTETKVYKDLAEQYDQLQQRAGRLTDAQSDMQARIKYLADDYGKFKAVLQGMQAAMGIVSVFSGFTSMLGIHSERVEKVTKNLAAMIAVMQGLKQVQELLNKDNYFVQFIKNTPVFSSSAKKVSAALQAIGVSAKAMAGYIGLAVVGITAFVKALRAIRSDVFFEFNKELDKTTDKVERLQKSTEFLESQFGSFGVSISGVTDRLKDTKKSVDEVIKSMMDAAIANKMAEKLDEIVKLTIDYAYYQEKANKEIEKNKRSIDELNRKTYSGKNYGNAVINAITSESGADYDQYISDRLVIEQLTDANNAYTKSLNEMYKQLTDKQREYSEMSNIVVDINTEWLRGIRNISAAQDEQTASVEHTTTATREEVSVVSEVIDVTKKLLDEQAKLYGDEVLKSLSNYNLELQNLRLQFYAGKLTLEQYDNEVKRLTADFQRIELEKQIENLKAIIDIKGEGVDSSTLLELEKLEQKLRDLDFQVVLDKAKSAKSEIDQFNEEMVRDAELQHQSVIDTYSTIANSIGSLYSQLGNIVNQFFDNQLSRLDEMSERTDKDYQQRKSIIEATIADETAKTRALEAIEREKLASDERITKQRADIERRKAKFDVATQIVKATSDAAAAIAQAVLSSAPGDPYSTPARIAAAVSAGVSAMATIIAALAQIGSIPAYERGGTAEAGKVFRAGEAGYEIGVGASGKRYLFDHDGLYMTKERVRILPHRQSEQMVSNVVNNNKKVTIDNTMTIKVIDNKRINKYFGV